MDHHNQIVNTIKRASADGIRSLECPFGDLSSKLTTTRMITQSILQDSIIVPDPLFSFCLNLQKRNMTATYSRALGLPQHDDLADLQAICRHMKAVSPYVAYGFLKFFPDYASAGEPAIPIYASPSGFADAFEENALRWIHDQARVSPIVKENGRFRILKGNKLTPCRFIHVEFSGSDGECSSTYTLHNSNASRTQGKDGLVTMSLEFFDPPPDRDVFRNWLFQSINQSATKYLERARKESSYASLFGAKYSPQNDFMLGLISQVFSVDEKRVVDQQPYHPITFSIQAPESTDINKFLRIRSDRDSLFSFRRYLNEKLQLLSSFRDQEDIRKASVEIQEELTRTHLPSLRAALSKLYKKETLRWITIGAGMGVGFVTQEGLVSGLIVLGLAAGGLRSTMSSLDKMKTMPGYFWNRLAKKR